MIKRIVAFILISLLISSMAFAGIDASAIFYASENALKEMCLLRGLEVGSAEEMRKKLYEYENLEAYTETIRSEEESEYVLSILSGDSLTKDGDMIILTGNASVSFRSGEEKEKILSAGTIVVDSANKKLTALEEVKFEDKSENASLNSISADIVSVFWDSGKLFVSDAITSSDRKNSEDENVTFYTQGQMLTYFPDGGILYEDGYIASNPDTQYSSIQAGSIAMLPGEDMFIADAWLNIGRVPILYLPFFFFPGSRVLGNPSFGFTSTMGAFLNTTFELLGTSEKLAKSSTESSFSAIFRSGESEDDTLYPVGYYYTNKETLSPIDEWAKNSGSYLNIMADAYSGSSTLDKRLKNGALHLGMDSSLAFFNKTLKLTMFNGIGLTEAPEEGVGKLRYYGKNTLSYSDFGLKLNAEFPFYSDRYVMMDFGNRLIGFSLDPILGSTPEFPTDYKSTITSYSRKLSASYSLPSKFTNTFISSLSISNLELKGSYIYDTRSTVRIDGKTIDNPDRFRYVLDELQIPSLSANISGSIFSFSSSSNNKKNQIVTAEAENNSQEDAIEPSELHILSDPLLKPLYEESLKSSANKSVGFSSSLKYSLSESLKNEDDYSYGERTSTEFTSSTTSKFTLQASLSDYFSITDVLSPGYSYSKKESFYEDYRRVSETRNTTLTNQLTVKIPFLGLSYSISNKIVNKKEVLNYDIDNDGKKTNEKETVTKLEAKWDKDTITQHSLSFSKTFNTEIGSFTPALSYTIDPLLSVINASLGYKYSGFTTAFSMKFQQKNEKEEIKPGLASFSVGYTGTYLTASTALKYDSTKYEEGKEFMLPFTGTASLSLRTKDKKYSVTESISYEYFNSIFDIHHYINSLKTSFSIPNLQLSLDWKTNPFKNKLEFRTIYLKSSLESAKWQFWKGRIYLSCGLTSEFNMDIMDPYSSRFTITPSLTFSIAEFLDFRFSFSSYNNSFYHYYDENGNFNVGLMFSDLGRSLDFFGDGRRNTFFVMKNASLEVLHYMEDWDLHCKYSAEVVKSGTNYRLQPKFSVYLAWKTMPELKVDESWSNDGTKWVKGTT